MHFYEFVANFLLTAKLHFPEHKIWSNMSTFELLQGPPIGQIHSYFAIESYAKNIDIFVKKYSQKLSFLYFSIFFLQTLFYYVHCMAQPLLRFG